MSVSWNGAGPKLMERIVAAVNKGLTEAAAVAANAASESFGSDHVGTPSAPGSPPNSQTGFLRNSVAYASPERLGTPLHAAFGTNVPYGRHLEFGATVTAKRTKFLPVPVNAPARLLLRQLKGASLRTSPRKLKFVKKDGRAMLLEVTPAKGQIKKGGAVFVLKRSVRIAPRPWIKRAAEKSRNDMAAAFRSTLRKELGL